MVEDAAHLLHYLSTNALLVKIVIKEEYRIIPIHLNDRAFLGFYWCTLIVMSTLV